MKRLIMNEIIKIDEKGSCLIGERCLECGEVTYPPKGICQRCQSDNIEKVELSTKGKLYSYTVTRMPTIHFEPPKALGYVDLPEGVRVFAPLEDRPDFTYEIGEELELNICKSWVEKDEDGNNVSVIGYEFVSPKREQ